MILVVVVVMIVVIMTMNFMMMTIMLLIAASHLYPPTTTTTAARAHKDKPLATSTLPNPILGNLGTVEMIWKEGRWGQKEAILSVRNQNMCSYLP